jgi:hypothetical protein
MSYAFLNSPMRATGPAHLILDLIPPVTFCEREQTMNTKLGGPLGALPNIWKSHFILSSLLGPNILLGIIFSNTLSLCSYLMAKFNPLNPSGAIHTQMQTGATCENKIRTLSGFTGT